MGHIALKGTALAGLAVACMIPGTAMAQQDKGSAVEKGSLFYFSKVDIRWDDLGFVTQDTFLSLTNDYPLSVQIQMYFINGDPPLAADPVTGERSHEGWNWLDQGIMLTADQPTYWSAPTGQPANGGLAPFPSLDPGFPPGRPADDGNGRMMRGYIVGWAVDFENNPISWNHLAGNGTIVNYLDAFAWEYNSHNHQSLLDFNTVVSTNGTLLLDGAAYSEAYDLLLMNFQASGSDAFSGPRLVVSNTDLTLHPLKIDVRQDNDGPVTTKADILIWNMNEVKFSGAHRCITCWDQTLISAYGTPNNFLLTTIQTDHAKARIDGVASDECDLGGIISVDASLIGLAARLLSFDGGADHAAAGTNLVGMGTDNTACIFYDVDGPPPPAGDKAKEIIDWLDAEVDSALNIGSRR